MDGANANYYRLRMRDVMRDVLSQTIRWRDVIGCNKKKHYANDAASSCKFLQTFATFKKYFIVAFINRVAIVNI